MFILSTTFFILFKKHYAFDSSRNVLVLRRNNFGTLYGLDSKGNFLL